MTLPLRIVTHDDTGLTLPYRVMIMKYPHGNSLGTLCLIWKVPEELDETRNAQVMFSSVMKCINSALEKCDETSLKSISMLLIHPKSILRFYRDLTDDFSTASSVLQKEVDERAVLAVECPDIMLDLRKLNGKPESTHFGQRCQHSWRKLIPQLMTVGMGKHFTCL